jgi:hypothetical protein
MMSSADKTKLDAHVNPGVPTSGSTIHANATQAVPGFESAADKTKLDGIEAGAQVNQNTFAIVKVGAVSVEADAMSDTLEIVGSTYIAVTGNATTDTITLEAQNITPSSHIGSNGSAHAIATTAVNGFMSATDKTNFNAHINTATPTKGTAIHGVADAVNAGFMSAAHYTKLTSGVVENTGNQSIAGTKTLNDPVVVSDTVNPLMGDKFRYTPEGGRALKFINKTGAPTVKGGLAGIHTTIADAVILCPSGTKKGIGYFYEDGVPDGEECWIVDSGKAHMLPVAGEAAIESYYVCISASVDGRVKTESAVGDNAVMGLWLESKPAGVLALGLIKYSL